MTTTTELAPEELVRIAVGNYSGKGYDSIGNCLFALLTDVADLYVQRLENGEGADDPAPFFGATPTEATINGLIENLQMRREDG